VNNASYTLWNSFNKAITSTESCWQYNPCAKDDTQCYWCPSKSPTIKPTFSPTNVQVPSVSVAPTASIEGQISTGDVAIIAINTCMYCTIK
jgi:hypothetical protein